MGEDENIKEDEDSKEESEEGLGEDTKEEKEEEIKEEKVLIKTTTNIRFKIGKDPVTIPAETFVRCDAKLAAEWIDEELAVYFDEKKIKVMEI